MSNGNDAAAAAQAHCPLCGRRALVSLHNEHWKCGACLCEFLIYIESPVDPGDTEPLTPRAYGQRREPYRRK